MDDLEWTISDLRQRIRRSVASKDHAELAELRVQLRLAEKRWDEALEELAPAPPATSPLLPLREQVHQALTLLTVPSAPKMIAAVREAFFAGAMAGGQLTHLRRDEERSFRSSPHARPYYLCHALTADRLTPVRGLLAVSTWPMQRRVMGSLSARVDFLTAAIRVAEHTQGRAAAGSPARQLLRRFAENIPGAWADGEDASPARVTDAARAELDVHDHSDRVQRRQAAARANKQLDECQQLFGAAPLGVARQAGGQG
jgi:hypothetical protein